MNYQARVLGIRNLDFTNDQKERINGCQVFVSFVSNESSWIKGVEVGKVWIKADSDEHAAAAALIPGDEVTVYFNRNGKLKIHW